ncbi:MAG: acyltransferase [Clostridiales bacterium]|nr:acyltransferase [Clostridiales bacterium]
MIDVLTSFRFIAAFFVFLHHTINSGLGFGERGVTYFFILSGFILAYRYYEKFYQRLEARDVLSFYSSRLSRIYPVHLLTFIVAIIFILIAPSHFYLRNAPANLLLMQSLFPKDVFTFNPAAWSLSVEMTFYIIFPFLIFALSKVILRSKHVSDIRFSTLFTLLILILLVQAAVVLYVKDTQPPMSLRWWLMYVSPFRATDFSIGVILSLIYMKCKKGRIFIGNSGASAKQNLVFTLFEIAAVLLVLVSFFKPIYKLNAAMFSVNYVPSLAFLILVFSFQNGFLSKVLKHKAFVFLGEISFSFFMLHYFVMAFFHETLNIQGKRISLPILLVSLIISALTYKYFEMASRDKLRNFFTRLIDRILSRRSSIELQAATKEDK